MPSTALSKYSLRMRLRQHLCFTSLQLAQEHMRTARQLLSSQRKQDLEAALESIEAALEQCPFLEKALELRARILLRMRRFKQLVEMLRDYVPNTIHLTTFFEVPSPPPSPLKIIESPPRKENGRILFSQESYTDELLLLSSGNHPFFLSKLRRRLGSPPPYRKTGQNQEWRYLVLGQACFHLGMLEEAMVLLQNGKRTASAVLRLHCNRLRDDNFASEGSLASTRQMDDCLDADAVTRMLDNIKFLLRRRTAGMAALQAGLYTESVRHFSKIIDGRKGSPSGFIADCYLQRAIAYQATGRVVDAISDCNRSLALNPYCARALSVRASIFENVGCHSECLLDLQHLKMLYDASLRSQMLPETRTWRMRNRLPPDFDLAGGLDDINCRIAAARKRLRDICSLDAHTILDLPKSCSTDDAKRAYLVLSLKHRADMATQFIDRCELADDERDMANLKEEVHASANRLSNLIHKAYIKVLSSIADENRVLNQGFLAGHAENSMARKKLIEKVDLGKVDSAVKLDHGKDAVTYASVDGQTDEENVCSSTVGSVEETHDDSERDACDYCQPFGGLTTADLAHALSHALLIDMSASSASATEFNPWMHRWSPSISQPLKVT